VETTRIPRGGCATLTDIDACVIRVEPVGDELWAQLLVTYGQHQKVCTMRPNDPLDLPDGVRLTVLDITQVDDQEPFVHLCYESTGR